MVRTQSKSKGAWLRARETKRDEGRTGTERESGEGRRGEASKQTRNNPNVGKNTVHLSESRNLCIYIVLTVRSTSIIISKSPLPIARPEGRKDRRENAEQSERNSEDFLHNNVTILRPLCENT